MAIQRPGSANTSTWFQDDPFAGLAAGLFSSPARPRKDLLGGLGQYGTGPLTHRRFSEQLGATPSIESLTRARHEDVARGIDQYRGKIDEAHNRGAGGRLEDSASAGRAEAARGQASAGLAPGSLASVAMRNEAAAGALDRGMGREAALEADLRRFRAQGYGDVSNQLAGLAGAERENADRLFGQYAFSEQMKQQVRQQEQAQYLAERQLQLQALGSPRLANAFANQRRI